MARRFLTPIDLNKLELQNAAIQNLAVAPGSPNVGQVYYDTNDNKIKVWTGSAWDNVGSSQEEIEDYVNGLLASGDGIFLDYDDDGNSLTIENTGVLSLLGTANEVEVSASAGNVQISLPDTINADTTGNAATATALETARTISLSGGASGSASFDGTADITIPVVVDSNSAVISIAGTPNEIDVSASVGSVTLSLPDTIAADISGNAASATYAVTAGTANSVAADSVALGTDTTGDYVADVTAGTGISVTGTGEGASVTVTNTGVVSLVGTDDEITVSASAGNVNIGLPENVTVAGDLTVSGNLTISGSATYVNTEVIELADNTIILNSNATGPATEDAGIEVERGDDPNVSVIWDESGNEWTVTNDGSNYAAIARKVAANVGNGASASFTVVHNLGTQDVTVQVYDNATYDNVEVDVVRGNGLGSNLDDEVTVTFAVAPALDAYRVVIVG